MVLEQATQLLPNISGSSIGLMIFGIITVLIVAGGIGFLAFWLIMRSKYNKKIIVFENISGTGYQPTLKDKARTIKVGKGGEEVLKLLKLKTYRPAYGKRMGKNTYWFAVGSDGYWYNVTVSDLDKSLSEMKIQPTSSSMRYQYTALEQAINARDNQEGFWQKYGNMIISIGFIAVIGVFTFLIFREFSAITQGAQQAISAAEQVMDKAEQVVGALDNIQTGGSGLQ